MSDTLHRALKSTLEYATQLHGVIKEETFEAAVTDDGGLVTWLMLDGAANVMSRDDLFHDVIPQLQNSLRAIMSEPGVTIDLRYWRDATRSEKEYAIAMDILKKRMHYIGFKDSFDRVLDARTKNLAQWFVPQGVMMAVTTHPARLGKGELKRAFESRKRRRQASVLPEYMILHGQNPEMAIEELKVKHAGILNTLLVGFRHAQIGLRMIDMNTATAMIRHQTGRDSFYNGQRLLNGEKMYREPGDPGTIRAEGPDVRFVPPRLAQFCLPAAMSHDHYGIVDSGAGLFAPTQVQLGPLNQDETSFSTLLAHISETTDHLSRKNDIPMSITYRLHSQQSGRLSWRKTGATFMKALNKEHNALIQDSVDSITLQARSGKDPVCGLQIIAETWGWRDEVIDAHKTLHDVVLERQEVLNKLLESAWTVAITQSIIDPIQAHLACSPGLTPHNPAPLLPVNLTDAMRLLPLAMASSAWESDPFTATMWYRSPQMKRLPVGFSPEQLNNFVVAILGPSGFGKSVTIANQIMALILAQTTRLPSIAVVDVGYGSQALMELLRHHLKDPDQVLGFTLTDSGMHINPFDTSLGYRFPTSAHKEFLANFLTIITKPSPKKEAPEFLGDLAAMVVNGAYQLTADRPGGHAHIYEPGKDARIDAAIQETGLSADSDTTWWEIVDALFLQNRIHEAGLAQRYAVPTLNDCISVCSDNEAVHQRFGNVIGGNTTKMPLIDMMSLGITQAISNWKMLSGYSDFDLGHARIISVNLERMVKDKSDQGVKKASAMYLLARTMLTQDFLFSADDAQDAEIKTAPSSRPELFKRYVQYHESRAKQIIVTPKMGIYDELHNTQGLPEISDQINKDAREWRKIKGFLVLASQSEKDYTEELLQEFASMVYVLGNPSEKKDGALQQRFGLSDTYMGFIRAHCKGGSPIGSGTFCRWVTKRGTINQIGYMMAPASELWAYTTTPEDRELRNLLRSMIGYEDALITLAGASPGGSSVNQQMKYKTMLENHTVLRDRLRKQYPDYDPETAYMAEVLSDEYQKHWRSRVSASLSELMDNSEELKAFIEKKLEGGDAEGVIADLAAEFMAERGKEMAA
ncbi:hypothetical protein A4U49_05975 [Acidithiobacillus ferrivorans]|uniref:hypothetical protein n=1 Tax=Acidithiobacillus ferrivorans TaxID=160808 RepID=UPI000892D43D|nr:hypothetical protein [Acidithiobacillus ferrivorans]OFA16725.1 hypothetical protein A4U49_05975 [Acidithiobacillus ferrivorans]